jgi:hypothetical protein
VAINRLIFLDDTIDILKKYVHKRGEIIMDNNQEYFVIYSNSSRNNGGLKPQVMLTTTKTIIEAAAWEIWVERGQSFEDLVGIPRIEVDGYLEYERALTDIELFNLSIEILGDGGRFYDIYATKRAKEFIANANNYGLADEAKAIVKSFFGDKTSDTDES